MRGLELFVEVDVKRDVNVALLLLLAELGKLLFDETLNI